MTAFVISCLISIAQFGAISDDGLDDTAAIQAAVTLASAGNGCVVDVPSGTWSLARGGKWWSIRITSARNVILQGRGPQSVLQLLPGAYAAGGDLALVYIDGAATRIALRDLMIDGNRDQLISASEQTHGVVVRNATHVSIERVWLVENWGDGLKGWCNPSLGESVDYLLVVHSTFLDNGRSGITFQRALNKARVESNLFISNADQAIDFEPTGGITIDDASIAGNTIYHDTRAIAVTLSYGRRTRFEGNRIIDGVVLLYSAEDPLLVGNQIRADQTVEGVQNLPGLSIQRLTTGATIVDNHIEGELGGAAIVLGLSAGSRPSRVVVASNQLRGITGINVTGAAQLIIEGNQIVSNNPESGIGINLDNLDVVPSAGHVITGNVVSDFALGIHVAESGNDVTDLRVVGNVVLPPTVPSVKLECTHGHVVARADVVASGDVSRVGACW